MTVDEVMSSDVYKLFCAEHDGLLSEGHCGKYAVYKDGKRIAIVDTEELANKYQPDLVGLIRQRPPYRYRRIK